MERFPHLPVEEDGRLHDIILRENFIERIFIHRRWRGLLAHNRTVGSLVQFHTRHKLLLLAHSEKGYRELGRWWPGQSRYPTTNSSPTTNTR